MGERELGRLGRLNNEEVEVRPRMGFEDSGFYLLYLGVKLAYLGELRRDIFWGNCLINNSNHLSSLGLEEPTSVGKSDPDGIRAY